jgi:hypothetical protein
MSGVTKSAPGETRSAGGGLSRVRVPMLQRDCSCGGAKTQCDSCNQKAKKKDTLLQRSPAAPSAPAPAFAPASVTSTLASPGRPLDAPTRSFMEPRFGRDFGEVRVHTDSASAQSAKDVNANAYTVGQHIVFDEGKYNPGSHSGKQLIAHELAHTVQQSGLQRSTDSLNLSETNEYHRLEHEAESVSRNVMASPGFAANFPTTQAQGPILSRVSKTKPSEQPAPKDEGSRDWEDVTAGPLKSKGVKQIAWAPAGSVVADVAVNLGELELPAEKGNVQSNWDKLAKAGGLETIVDITGEARPKVALKQGRPDTTELKKIWIQKVKWTREQTEDNWKLATKDKTDTFWKSATAKGGLCHVDHIVELQFGGDNVQENMQMLDGSENMSSGAKISANLKNKAAEIREALGGKAKNVKNIVLHYDKATQTGNTCKACCDADAAAMSGVAGKAEAGAAEPNAEKYHISAGGREADVYLVAGKGKKNEIQLLNSEVPQNASASTLIPGMLLKELIRAGGHGKDHINARFDTDKDETKTRLPLNFQKYSDKIVLHVMQGGVLKLDTTNAKLRFDYGYLSPGVIEHLKLEDDGSFSGTGVIHPTVKFLPKLQMVFDKSSFKLVAGLDAEKLKPPFPGVKFTKGQFNLQIAPTFEPSAELEMVLGPPNKRLATAGVKVEPDPEGIKATFKITPHIPKLETAESTITYIGGGEKERWEGTIDIESKKINLGSKISVTGGFQGHITSSGIDFTGKISATLPGNNTAELGLKKDGDEWILQGKGVFHFKGLDETTAEVEYNLTRGSLYAKGKTGFHLEKLDLKGELNPVKIAMKDGEEPKVAGTGKMHIKKGKVEGDATVERDWDGKFSGEGSVTYAIKPNLIVTAKVKLSKDQKLKFDGELLLTRYELFEKHGAKKNLFSVGMDIPVPGLSIGSLGGVMFHIGGGVDAEYSFGPGTLEPLKIAASFEPLEENPNIDVEVGGEVKVPAKATLSAFIEGSLRVKIDVVIGSAGAEGGIKLQGDLILEGGVFAKFNARYRGGHLSAKVDAGLETKLLLGLSLGLFVHAWAGAFGLSADVRKDWTLAKKTVDTGLGFYMSAPIEYADDKPFKFPSIEDVTIKKPDLTVANMKRIVGELFSSESGAVN